MKNKNFSKKFLLGFLIAIVIFLTRDGRSKRFLSAIDVNSIGKKS